MKWITYACSTDEYNKLTTKLASVKRKFKIFRGWG